MIHAGVSLEEVALPLEPGAPSAPAARSRTWIRLERTTPHDRLMHEGPLLILASLVVGLSFFLPTLKSHHAWVSIPCLFYKVTHVPCLACGLTRSFTYTAHGNLASAFGMHLLGPLLFVMTCVVTLYLVVSLATGVRARFDFSARTRRIAFWTVLGIFCVSWGIKIAFMRGSW